MNTVQEIIGCEKIVVMWEKELRHRAAARVRARTGQCYNQGLVLVILTAGNLFNLITTTSFLYQDSNILISIS